MQFTAMAILMLQAQDKLNVQDPVCLYIPECPTTWQDITIHQLLTHTSGIPNPEQMIARFKDKPLDFPPGEQWSYSNSSYIVLGYIIEQVSDQSYEAFYNKISLSLCK
jgi:CubicO group peptidase (beta-lactamase class C family)